MNHISIFSKHEVITIFGDNSKKTPSGTAVFDDVVFDAIFGDSGHMTV